MLSSWVWVSAVEEIASSTDSTQDEFFQIDNKRAAINVELNDNNFQTEILTQEDSEDEVAIQAADKARQASQELQTALDNVTVAAINSYEDVELSDATSALSSSLQSAQTTITDVLAIEAASYSKVADLLIEANHLLKEKAYKKVLFL